MPDPPFARRATARASAGRRKPRRLTVTITDEGGRPVPVPGLAPWLSRAAPARARGSVTVAIVGDARMRELNHRFRRKNYATDVLSFPASAQPPASSPRFLGDIVVAHGVARRQARDAGHDELTELRILALHGLLHLLGYDHERDDGRMLRLERRLRRKGGLREGLIERAQTGSR